MTDQGLQERVERLMLKPCRDSNRCGQHGWRRCDPCSDRDDFLTAASRVVEAITTSSEAHGYCVVCNGPWDADHLEGCALEREGLVPATKREGP